MKSVLEEMKHLIDENSEEEKEEEKKDDAQPEWSSGMN